MNKIVEKIGENGEISYEITVDDKVIIGKLWTEKKIIKDVERENVHIRWTDPETGKYRYMMKSVFDEKKVDGTVELPEKVEKSSGGGWRAKMTDDEAAEMESLEARIAEIKEAASARETVKIDPNSPEGIALQIEKLKAKLAKATKA